MSRRALVFLPFALVAMVLAGTVTAGTQEITVTPSHQSGWYQSALTLSWTVTGNPDFTSGCGDTLINESAPATYTCSAQLASGQPTSVSVQIGVDLTNPTLPAPPDVGPLQATGPSGLVVNYGLPSASDNLSTPTVACSPAPGSLFPVGETTVTCTATDDSGRSTSASFKVTVSPADTTPPTFTSTPPNLILPDLGSPGEVVNYAAPTATDDQDPSVAISCSPPSGSTFTSGTTTVACTATDDAGNSATTSFTVTVNPNGAPTVTVNITSQQPAEAVGPSGAPVSFTVNVSDPEEKPDPQAQCNRASGSTFPLGSTTITCSATDSGGVTGSGSATANVVDTTPPTVSVPGSMTVQPTSPSGAPVSFNATASDLVDGSIAPNCNHSSGETFPLGTTLVTCTAQDSRGNTGSNSFSVSVQDADAPVVNVPASITVEANGPNGAVVNYAAVTATDTGSGTLQATCFPPSGATIPLGTWLVECTATDSSGNIGRASFSIRVRDTTPPVLTIPGALAIQSSGPVAATDSRIRTFLGGATATDIVDTNPAVTTNAPSSFPVGVTTVTFTARDDAGNTTQKDATVTISPDPVGPQPGGDTTPPQNVSNVRAILGNLAVSLSWKPPAKDFDHVDIVQSPGRSGNDEAVVYSGKKSSFVAKGLAKGTEYRFVLIAFDKAGNRAAGVAVVALAQTQTLLAPPNGAVVSSAPLVKWKPVKGTRYYNAQIWYEGPGGGKAVLAGKAVRKVLSVWPTKPSFKMKKSWRYAGKRVSLQPGRYLLYIWPGVGAKAAGRYGKMIVQAEFTYRRGG